MDRRPHGIAQTGRPAAVALQTPQCRLAAGEPPACVGVGDPLRGTRIGEAANPGPVLFDAAAATAAAAVSSGGADTSLSVDQLALWRAAEAQLGLRAAGQVRRSVAPDGPVSPALPADLHPLGGTVAAAGFQGPRAGYFFGTRQGVLGYHRDVREAPPATGGPAAGRAGPRALQLAPLLQWEPQPVPGCRRARRRRQPDGARVRTRRARWRRGWRHGPGASPGWLGRWSPPCVWGVDHRHSQQQLLGHCCGLRLASLLSRPAAASGAQTAHDRAPRSGRPGGQEAGLEGRVHACAHHPA